MEEFIKTLEIDGVVVMNNVYDGEQFEKIRFRFHEEWNAIYSEINNLDWKIAKFKKVDSPTFFLDNAIYQGKKFAQWKDYNVIDMNYGRYDFTNGGEIDFLMTDKIGEIVNYFLKDNWSGFWGGLPVVSGGNTAGYWHRDIISLFEDETFDLAVPTFYLTMIIPLEDISMGEGTTEFVKGSHKINFWNSGIRSNKQLQEWISERDILNGDMKANSVCIFNGLTVHRGGKNTSHKCRNAIYIVFKKNWYSDDDPKYYDLVKE